MNSCLYECNVMHHRMHPKRHRFTYRVFMFYIDLEELDMLSEKMRFLSRNKANIFNFRDADHLEFSGRNIQENIREYLRTNGMDLPDGKIMLLTHLRTFGHIFNPVSFYFCFDRENHPVCCIAEIGNTFREMKPFFFGKELLQNGAFRQQTTKYFYVSPFIDLDATFDFHLGVPGEKLNIQINDFQKEEKFFVSTLTGNRKDLTDGRLAWYSLRFPLITVQVISAIHWQAFLLWLKRIPFHRKEANLQLQRGMYRGKSAQ